jgi:hypothetical protein
MPLLTALSEWDSQEGRERHCSQHSWNGTQQEGGDMSVAQQVRAVGGEGHRRGIVGSSATWKWSKWDLPDFWHKGQQSNLMSMNYFNSIFARVLYNKEREPSHPGNLLISSYRMFSPQYGSFPFLMPLLHCLSPPPCFAGGNQYWKLYCVTPFGGSSPQLCEPHYC